jgi:hypothetical protein
VASLPACIAHEIGLVRQHILRYGDLLATTLAAVGLPAQPAVLLDKKTRDKINISKNHNFF